jgi:hypothetical protein
MNGCDWLICERRPRWAPALRLALESENANGGTSHRIREVRHLHEVVPQLLEHPATVAALETHRGNLAEVLAWLTSPAHHFPRARFVAFLDRSLFTDAGPPTAPAIVDALREAGISEIADSPRRLHTVLQLARRHAAVLSHEAPSDDNLSITARAWASLPWQPT